MIKITLKKFGNIEFIDAQEIYIWLNAKEKGKDTVGILPTCHYTVEDAKKTMELNTEPNLSLISLIPPKEILITDATIFDSKANYRLAYHNAFKKLLDDKKIYEKVEVVL
jgi:hypothetical protein